jgi:hypothetical protein
MDILKRIDLAQQFCKQYADGAWSIEKDKWNYHVTPEFIEDIRQNIESLHLKLMHLQTQQAKREVCKSESYDMVDRFLRNNLYDDDYESYSSALDEVAAGAQSPTALELMKSYSDGKQWALEEAAREFDIRSRLLDGSISPGWYEVTEPAEIIRNMAR